MYRTGKRRVEQVGEIPPRPVPLATLKSETVSLPLVGLKAIRLLSQSLSAGGRLPARVEV